MALPDRLNMNIGEGRDGRCAFDLRVEEMHHNVEGMLHGGVISTMIDLAMARAIRSVVPQDKEIMTITLTVNFFGSVSEGTIQVVGTTVWKGSRLASAEAELRAGDLLLARGTGTWYVRPRRPVRAE